MEFLMHGVTLWERITYGSNSSWKERPTGKRVIDEERTERGVERDGSEGDTVTRALANHPSLVSLLSPFPTSLTSLASPYPLHTPRSRLSLLTSFSRFAWRVEGTEGNRNEKTRGGWMACDRRAVHRSLRSLLPSRSATPAPRLFARGRRTAPLLVPRRSLITSPFGTGSARWTGAPHAVRRCLRRVVDIEWRAFP